MSCFNSMSCVKQDLVEAGVNAFIPASDEELRAKVTIDAFEVLKRKVSFSYLNKIRDPRTFGVLAVNPEKYSISNYIGPNTFAEIAVAFAHQKKIFLYYGMPDVYVDELKAWRAMPLNGDITPLVKSYYDAVNAEGRQTGHPSQK